MSRRSRRPLSGGDHRDLERDVEYCRERSRTVSARGGSARTFTLFATTVRRVRWTWTASRHEGNYEIEVSVRNQDSGESATASTIYQFASRISDTSPVISPTANPLVFLYSAPPCAPESRMRVEFQSADGFTQYTPYQECSLGLSMNFYLAGLRPGTDYAVKQTIDTGFEFVDGPVLTLTTPAVSLQVPKSRVQQPPAAPESTGILLHSSLAGPSFATDLLGNLVWFYSGRDYISDAAGTRRIVSGPDRRPEARCRPADPARIRSGGDDASRDQRGAYQRATRGAGKAADRSLSPRSARHAGRENGWSWRARSGC